MRLLLSFLILPAIAFAQDVPPSGDMTQAEMTPSASQSGPISSDPYTVTDVIVDVSADDAVAARKEAFDKGPTLALAKYLAQNGSTLDAEGLDADRLVNDFQVMEERFSRTRYVANLTYHFKPAATARLLDPSLPPETTSTAPAGPMQMEPIVDDPGLVGPVDPDAPYIPNPAPQPAPADVAPGQGPQTWPLSVRYNQVTQWLMTQDLLTARPEIRGIKLLTMTGDSAKLTVTTDEPPAEVRARWQSLGWNVSDDGAGGLILQAGPTGGQ